MAFVKANLTIVITAAVVLLALGLCVWPTMGWNDTTKAQMLGRIDQAKAAGMLIMPTLEVIPGGLSLKGATVEPNVIRAKKSALETMTRQAEEVAKLAATQNLIHRIIVEKSPGNPEREIPLLAGLRQEDHFLPTVVQPADPFGFKTDYERQFPAWVLKLGGGTPPTVADVTLLINLQRAERTRQAAAAGAILGDRGAAGQTELSVKEQNLIKKAAVISKASKILCYVDDNALQKRDWYGRSNPPTETQIFEAFVDSWFQQDVVNAVVTLNEKVLKEQPGDKNVGRAPVKRLESIVIGNGALATSGGGGPGTLFMAMTSVAGPAGGAAAAAGFASPGVDVSRSLTGHVGSAEYDVVLMKIIVDIDPAYENQFIEALYRQNNGYTVLNRSLRVVDPLEATSNGFLYGQTQVIRLELLVEGLLFRSWTVPLMPDAIRRPLGITTPALTPVR